MTEILDLVFSANRLRVRYLRTHHQVFGLSWSRVADLLRRGSGEIWEKREKHLDDQLDELDQILARVRQIPDSKIHKHSGILLRPKLIDYLEALRQSMQTLRSICAKLRLEREGNPEYAHYGGDGFRVDRVAYDEALSRERRCGSVLTQMLEKF